MALFLLLHCLSTYDTIIVKGGEKMNDKRITLVINDELKQKLFKEAESKGISASSLIRILVTDYFKKEV